MERMKMLLESYYGTTAESTVESIEDIDSKAFDSKTYTTKCLTTTNFLPLLKKDDTLFQEVRGLDADMQLLVYDNYSKFIDATDIIRKMKEKVSDIEVDVHKLSTKLENIDSMSRDHSSRMGGKREKIEKLVRLQRLLRKLNFLFELPLRLKQCIDMDAKPQAVSYYIKAMPILQRHGEVPSFSPIARESHEIMQQLELSLKTACIHENDLTHSKFNENVEMYLHLSRSLHPQLVSSDDMRQRFMSWNEDYLTNRIQRLTETNRDFSLEGFVDEICSSVLEMLSDTCDLFTKLFIEPFPDEAPALRADLTDFTKPLLLNLLNSIRARLVDDDVCLSSNSVKSEDDNEEAEDTDSTHSQDGDADEVRLKKKPSRNERQRQFQPLLKALKTLISRLHGHRIGEYLKPLNLVDRTAEICEHAIRKQVVVSFDALRTQVSSLLLDTQHDAIEQVDETAKMLSVMIEDEIASTMTELDLLLDASSELVSEVSAIFENLIKFQMRFWILWLCNMFECLADFNCPYRKSSVPLLCWKEAAENPERTSIHVEIPTMDHQASWKFLLVLVQLSQYIRTFVKKTNYSISGVPELMNELDTTKDNVLQAVVRSCASQLCKTIYTVSLQSKEHLEVSEYVIGIVEQLRVISKEIKLIVQEEQVVQEAAEVQRGNRYHRPSVSLGYVHRDAERLFQKQVSMTESVDLSSSDVVRAILKIVLKTLLEHIRDSTLSQEEFHQYEVDLHYLKSTTLILVSQEHSDTVQLLLVQLANVVKSRSLSTESVGPDALERCSNAARESARWGK